MRCVDGACDAEVGDLHVTVRADENVCGLHVAVHHTIAMGEGESGSHLDSNVTGLVGGQLALHAQDVGEGAALHVFHGHEVGVTAAAPVIDPDDVGVIQVGGRLGFAAESLDKSGVGGELGEQHLDGDRSVEQKVAGQKDVGHATTADAAFDLVAVVHHRAVLVTHNCSTQASHWARVTRLRQAVVLRQALRVFHRYLHLFPRSRLST